MTFKLRRVNSFWDLSETRETVYFRSSVSNFNLNLILSTSFPQPLSLKNNTNHWFYSVIAGPYLISVFDLKDEESRPIRSSQRSSISPLQRVLPPITGHWQRVSTSRNSVPDNGLLLSDLVFPVRNKWKVWLDVAVVWYNANRRYPCSMTRQKQRLFVI